MHIYCLSVIGGTLSPEVFSTLLEAAKVMIKQKKQRLQIKRASIQMDGEITTENKSQMVGTVTGTLFSATINHAGKTIISEFIVESPGPQEICPQCLFDSLLSFLKEKSVSLTLN